MLSIDLRTRGCDTRDIAKVLEHKTLSFWLMSHLGEGWVRQIMDFSSGGDDICICTIIFTIRYWAQRMRDDGLKQLLQWQPKTLAGSSIVGTFWSLPQDGGTCPPTS